MASDRQRPVPRPGRRALVGLVSMVGLVAVSFGGACGSDDADDAPAAATATTGATTSGAASVAGSGSAAYCEAVDELLGVLAPASLADGGNRAEGGEAEGDDGADDGQPVDDGEATEPLEELARVAAYDRLITQVHELAPTEHARAWELLAAVSEEPFSYDRFNPAVDELERIDTDLEARCPDLGRFVVDDHGRLTRW
jgi:hypothetical protein